MCCDGRRQLAASMDRSPASRRGLFLGVTLMIEFEQPIKNLVSDSFIGSGRGRLHSSPKARGRHPESEPRPLSPAYRYGSRNLSNAGELRRTPANENAL